MFRKVVIFLASFFLGMHIIGYLGSFYVNKATGYEIGNRRRLISVLKLGWISFILSFLVYAHLFSIFQLPYTIFNVNGKSEHLKQRLKRAFIILMFLSNIVYIFYLIHVPWLLFEFCAILQGVWLHLVFFSVLFICLNGFVSTLNCCLIGQRFLMFVYGCSNWLKRICTETQLQVLITMISTLVLCLIQWYSSDKIVIKELTLPMKNIHPDSTIKIAVISDLHSAGTVYRDQISKVVDETNSLKADIVMIVGDAVDAPVSWIKSRMEPLKFLRSKNGVYMTSGNHEYYYGSALEWFDLFESYGIKVLQNDVHLFDNNMCLCGLNDISSENSGIPNHKMDVSALSQCPSNSSIVVMAHNPAAVKKITNYSTNRSLPVELILSGHTHAGQYYILVPWVWFLLPFWHGLYHQGNTQILVSAGTLYQAAPMKMWRMSEIWLLTLTSN